VPHGVANAIVLPHAMRFNLEVSAAQLAPLTRAFGIDDGTSDLVAAEAAIDAVSELLAQLDLPRRLRDVDVDQHDIPRLADLALQSRAVQNNPRPVTAEDIEDLLRAMW